MSRRRRFTSAIAAGSEQRDARSRLARMAIADIFSVRRASLPRLNRVLYSPRLVVRSQRLGSNKFTISAAFAEQKHGSIKETRRCVSDKLVQSAKRVGSGSGTRRSRRDRNEVRREVFQAARRKC